MVDNFEVEPVFESRQHERHQFKLVIDGRNYKGDYTNGEIQWLNPHPKQNVDEAQLASVEAEIYALLDERGIKDDSDEIEIEKISNSQARDLHQFKLKIQGEYFKGVFFKNGEIEWFHPKPRRKLKDERVDEIEEKVQEKMKKELE